MGRVCITGMGIISPIGSTKEEFATSLLKSKSGIDYITAFDTTDFKVKIAAEVKDFDPSAFYDDKSEIRRTDKYVQYAMGAAVRAMEDSELKDINPDRFGVYIGSGVGGIQTFVTETNKLSDRGPSRVSPFFIAMMISNMASGSVAMRFDARGPNLPVVSACATSTNAIGEAYRAILHGYADVILAGGSEAAICPLAIAGFANSMALTESDDPTRASIPFDKQRSGFVMGEGAGVLVLEDYDHAKQRGANIYAEIVGYGNTCDAYHITAPHPQGRGAARAMATAIQEAKLDISKRIYINAHGTSTPLNDKTETMAIKEVFGARAYEIPVSSTKSMTGHMLGAAGAVEAIAGVYALNSGIIPPTIGYEVPDEECDLDYVPNIPRVYKPEYILSNSFGFGGHNATLVIKKV